MFCGFGFFLLFLLLLLRRKLIRKRREQKYQLEDINEAVCWIFAETAALMEKLAGNGHDFIFVNIVADVIISLAPVLPKLAGDKGTVILSGILAATMSTADSQLLAAAQALTRSGMDIIARKAKEEWRCLTVKRRQA